MSFQTRLACGELARPFLDALLEKFGRLLQPFLGSPALFDTFDNPQCGEYMAILIAYRTDVDPYPDRFMRLPYKAFLELEMRKSSCSRGAPMSCALFPVIWMHDVEVRK